MLAGKLAGAFVAAALLCFGQAGGGTNTVDRAKVAALSKMFLRDSAELPMDVAVTTVVTEPAGKEKRRPQYGWFNTGALRGLRAFSLFEPKANSEKEFQIRPDQSGRGVLMDRFTVEIGGLPAPADIAYLGAVQISKILSEGDMQKAYWKNDPQPFFIPKRVVTTIETDKGSVVLTNAYTLTADRNGKK